MRGLFATVLVLVVTATLAVIAIVVAVHQLSAPRAGESGPPASQDRWDHDALEILGYVETVRVDDSLKPQFGVTLWDRDRAQPGLNLYNPRDKKWAVLVDMDGTEVHRWEPRSLGSISWTFAELLAGGDLLAILKDDSLVRVSWDSEVVWRVPMRTHHDVAAAPDGSIWALARTDAIITAEGIEIPILGDQLVRLSPDGEVLGIIDLWPHLVGWLNHNRIEKIRAFSDERGLLDAIRSADTDDQILEFATLPDFTHVNSIEIIDRDIPGICSTGDLLLMPRNLNRIVVFDPVAEEIRWSWSGGGVRARQAPPMIALAIRT